MIERFLGDSILAGIMIGLFSITLNYILLSNLNDVFGNFDSTKNILKEPRLQLVILLINVFLMRFMMLRWNRMRTGSGILIALFGAMIWFLYNNKQILHL